MFVLAVSTAFAAHAQTASFGIRGGANLSNLSGDLRDEDRFNNKVGFHAGVTLNFGIVSDFFSIQPELLYSEKGFENEDSEFSLLGQTYRREGKVNYSYLDLPVLLRIKAGPLYFEGGPQASYLLRVNNKTKTFINDELENTDVDEQSKEGLNDFEVGYAAGVGLTSANNAISIGVRYNGSFSDFVDEDVNFGGDLSNARHSVIMLTVGFAIPTGNR